MEVIGRMMTALITPFTSNNDIDYEAIQRIVNRLVLEGCDGLVICGTTGEAPNLDYQERYDLTVFIQKIVQKRVPIWLGCGTNSTKTTLQYVKIANELKVDGIMLVAPYYNKPTQRGLYEHFSYIAKNTMLPIMLYNVPGRTSCHLEADTIIRLANDFPNIVALKQAATDISDTEKIIGSSEITILSGNDGQLLEGLERGMYGIVSVVSHIVQPMIKKVIESYDLGVEDHITMQKIKDIAKLMFLESSPSPIKYALSLNHECLPKVRLPLVECEDSTKEKINDCIKSLK